MILNAIQNDSSCFFSDDPFFSILDSLDVVLDVILNDSSCLFSDDLLFSILESLSVIGNDSSRLFSDDPFFSSKVKKYLEHLQSLPKYIETYDCCCPGTMLQMQSMRKL